MLRGYFFIWKFFGVVWGGMGFKGFFLFVTLTTLNYYSVRGHYEGEVDDKVEGKKLLVI